MAPASPLTSWIEDAALLRHSAEHNEQHAQSPTLPRQAAPHVLPRSSLGGRLASIHILERRDATSASVGLIVGVSLFATALLLCSYLCWARGHSGMHGKKRKKKKRGKKRKDKAKEEEEAETKSGEDRWGKPRPKVVKARVRLWHGHVPQGHSVQHCSRHPHGYHFRHHHGHGRYNHADRRCKVSVKDVEDLVGRRPEPTHQARGVWDHSEQYWYGH